MRVRSSVPSCVAALLLLAAPAFAQHEMADEPPVDVGRVGAVHFPVTCLPERQGDFDQAVALLHSFFYEESERRFRAIAADQPHCAMAWWGVAMSLWHPLWEPPDSASLARGREAVARAQAAGPASPREAAWIDAIARFYRDSDKLDHRTRAQAYADAMRQLHESFPADTEATIFYALALNATLRYDDKTYANQRQAIALLAPIYAVNPDHPGVAHYLIHSYDAPPLAERGLAAARVYAGIAPSAPHALHMPSHIFTRVGAWQDSVALNRRSADVATKDGSLVDAYHAADYMIYAQLQLGRDQAARKTYAEFGSAGGARLPQFAGPYAAAAMPARLALERGDWAAASQLSMQGSAFPHVEAITAYARPASTAARFEAIASSHMPSRT